MDAYRVLLLPVMGRNPAVCGIGNNIKPEISLDSFV